MTLADVLVAIHRMLHTPIGHKDWEMLGVEDQQKVERAFTQRCRAEASRHAKASRRAEASRSRDPPAQLTDWEVVERELGVKRVDFLLGKTIFKGLDWVPGDPEARLMTM
ncbi:hypothetical protein K438DRAFT_1632263 [Mycena galopus ATCC 62051]|nr:hypothetical protein K438DRAFT_1632263 [Mycena galopus ATCC 62051]